MTVALGAFSVGKSLTSIGDCAFPNGGDIGIDETEGQEAMSEASFANAASQGYQTEDDEDTHTFNVSIDDPIGMAK